MEATGKERRQQQQQQRKAAAAAAAEGDSDTVQLPTETSPYVQHKDLEDYKMRGYGAQGHLPVSDVPHGGSGTDAPTVPGTAVPVAKPKRPDDDVQPQRDRETPSGGGGGGGGRGGGGGGGRSGDTTATDAINRHGVP